MEEKRGDKEYLELEGLELEGEKDYLKLAGRIDRRNFIKRTSLGILGAGALIASLEKMGENASAMHYKRPELLILSKDLHPQAVSVISCDRYTCDDQLGFVEVNITTKQWRKFLVDPAPCDETSMPHPDGREPKIPQGSVITTTRTLYLRTNPQACPNGPYSGYHQGSFMLRDPSGLILATGIVRGTNGFETHRTHGEDRCCVPWHEEGMLIGYGKPNTLLADCHIYASYSEYLPTQPSSTDPCDPNMWQNIHYNLDGVLECGCGQG